MNKRNIQYIKGLLLAVVALQLAPFIKAQEKSNLISPLTIELSKARSTWLESDNGAGIGLDSLGKFGLIDLAYNTTNGSFKRVQQGEKEKLLDVFTEGGQKNWQYLCLGTICLYKRNTERHSFQYGDARSISGSTLLSGRPQCE